MADLDAADAEGQASLTEWQARKQEVDLDSDDAG
jgi:hypothetical protein